jgi:phosphatidylserine decarboxylase
MEDIPTTLLFSESPLIGFTVLFVLFFCMYMKYNSAGIGVLILLVFLMFFYRTYDCDRVYDDNIIVCPADGIIQYIEDFPDHFCIGIFLGVHNVHTQVYPVNGVVEERVYDETGKFDLVVNGTKGRDNEKKMHLIKAKNGQTVILSQIAGFLPRRISSDNSIGSFVQAGQYLGIIKFGSRVDLKIEKPFVLSPMLRINSRVYVGDILGYIKK